MHGRRHRRCRRRGTPRCSRRQPSAARHHPVPGLVVDFHSNEFFPKRFFDLVVVLRTNNTVLYDRLMKRNYPASKVTENVECEIMQVVLDEARGAYDAEIVQVLQSDTVDQLEENVEKIGAWSKHWIANHAAAAPAM